MRISVALCAYNGEKYIRQQLCSILSQTVAVSEIVICDDCSSDSTVYIIEQIARQYPDVIRLIVNKKNIGFRENFEKALKECQGDYIFFSDQDDIWRQDKVEKSVAYLQETGYYGLFSDADLIDAEGGQLDDSLFKHFNVHQYIDNRDSYPDLFTTLCLSLNFVTGATMAISKEAKPIILPFRTSTSIYHDYYIALRLSAIEKFGYLTEKLISYRIHPSQQAGVNFSLSPKNRVFDFKYEGVANLDLFLYLLLRRRRTIYISSLCRFGKKERLKLNKSYRKYIRKVISAFPLSYHWKALFEFYYMEMYVALFLLIKRFRLRLLNHI